MGEMMGAERFRGRKRVAHDSTATAVLVRSFLGGGAATVPSARRFRKRPSQGSEKLRLDIILIKPKIAFYYMSGDKLGWLTTDMVMGKKKITCKKIVGVGDLGEPQQQHPPLAPQQRN
jgi:hypothetical protein